MNPNDVLGETIERGQKVIRQTASAAAASATGAVKAAAGQIAGDSNSQAKDNVAVSDEQAVSHKVQTEELVKELYAPSKSQNNQKAQPSGSQSETEEKAELASVRQKLHDEVYYQPLIQGTKTQEERPAEKVEKEKKQEMADLQKKEVKKPAPLAVQRSQQTAEKFRGVSG